MQRAQHATSYDTGRGGGRGLVEHPGRRGAPVDEQHVTVGVAHADAPDVARLGVDRRIEVEPAEHQPLVGGVELGDALGGLEDHRVALDEAALVLQACRGCALGRQRPCVHHGRLERT
ncbi:hypothetical protein ACNKF0_21085 [Nocardioides sp. T5]|uniref:hypothetical protein n=1 Tax=Nocardioides sp. T5 TaxID=3400182 RepID=UPI003A87A1FE